MKAFHWCGDRLELLDQRRLPHEVTYVTCRNSVEVDQAIRDMVVRGAPAIGCVAAFAMALDAQSQDWSLAQSKVSWMEAAARLAISRPTAVNLSWAIERMRSCLGTDCGVNPADRLLAEAMVIRDEDLRGNLLMGDYGARLLPEEGTIMTHCNTGSLATAGHGTALGVIRSALALGKRLRVIANETRPYLQGARLTAWECLQDGIPVSIATDSMAGHFMQRGMIAAVIVGADRIAENGDFANKIGTYTLAVLAREHGIPFYVAAPMSTIDFKVPHGRAIPIEERGSEEVTGFGGLRWAPLGVDALHPAFDVTPARLVTAIITDRGVVHHPESRGMHQLKAINVSS